MRRRLLAIALTLLGMLAGLAWLSATGSGLRAAARLAQAASGGRLDILRPTGRLIGPLAMAEVRWRGSGLALDIERLALDWRPARLAGGRLDIATLSVGRLAIAARPDSPPTPPPAGLRLPLAVDVEKLALSHLDYGPALAVDDLAARLASDGRYHRLEGLRARIAGVEIRAAATLDGGPGLAVSGQADLAGRVEGHPLAVHLAAGGRLDRLTLRAVGREGIAGEASAVLTPFAPTPLAGLRVALADIDPAAWRAGAPRARLALDADLVSGPDGLAGPLSLVNRLPGPLDRERLPLAGLSARLHWAAGAARLDDLKATLDGGGELAGAGDWRDGRLALDLRARRLDASRLVSRLRPTRLGGPLSATLAADRQEFRLDLADGRYRLRAEAGLAGGRVAVKELTLAAGAAELGGSGELALDGDGAFRFAGELRRFDPSVFASVPAARLNAAFSVAGRWRPRLAVDGHFRLADSRLAGRPLAGHGDLALSWPRVDRADIELNAGPNRLRARGGFGRPGATLTVDIAAPQLDPYGIEGGIDGHLALGGSLERPSLTAEAHAARLARPGLGEVRGLDLSARLGDGDDAPLAVDLRLARLADAAAETVIAKLRAHVAGSNRAHRLQAGFAFGDNRLDLDAEGGLRFGARGPAWQGRLLRLELGGADPARHARLQAPAALALSPGGWSLGPARLQGEPLDWNATLQAGADGKRLQASLTGQGAHRGRLDGELIAGMAGAWSVDRQAPWQGKLRVEIGDLGWLGQVIGEGWHSAGTVRGRLALAGTPARPRASGELSGEHLALGLSGQGLDLFNGELAVDFDEQALRVRKLVFDSRLRPLPRPLRVGLRGDKAAFERPGRLEISGQIRVDRGIAADRGDLDLRLDRVGVWQLPDQWVAVSGDGRLRWQADTLGVEGRLAVDAGYWQLAPAGSPRLSDDVVVHRPGDEKRAALRPGLDLDVSADLGRNFLFMGDGLTARLAGAVRLTARGRDLPRASGSIRTRDARFDAYGEQLDVEHGILTFQGLLDNPALDVRAVRKGLPVEAGVQIGGTARQPVVRLVSDPDLPEAEKLAWLVLGHGPESMGAGDATLLMSAAGGLLGNNSGGVVGQLKRTFGIDQFGVRQGSLGDAGGPAPGSRVAGGGIDTTASTGSQILSVGKRLSSNAMLSYEQTLGRTEGIVKLSVDLSRRVSLVGRAGSDNALDLFYTLTFGRPEAEGKDGGRR